MGRIAGPTHSAEVKFYRHRTTDVTTFGDTEVRALRTQAERVAKITVEGSPRFINSVICDAATSFELGEDAPDAYEPDSPDHADPSGPVDDPHREGWSYDG